MDDEHERQRRDLQRATRLLETMPREEMAEMLLDILTNERSDDTRKLSDWMAFQIILHDDTRHERELLAKLGKDGRNYRRSQMSQMMNASRRSPTSSRQEFKLQGDDLEDESSSTASFETCPEAEPVNAIQPKKDIAEDAAPVQIINGIRNKQPPRSEALMTLPSSSVETAKSQSAPPSTIRPQACKNARKDSEMVKSNDIGYKNLAELYARYDWAREEGKDPYQWYEHHEKPTQGSLDHGWSDRAQCRNCKLHFNYEDNTRDLDNGSSPCSYHPGGAAWIGAGLGRPFWTCCRREISWDDFVSDPKKTPGCMSGYHDNWKELRCCICNHLFTAERNGFQLDGSPPCSYHPGSAVPDARVGQVWTCCNATAHSKGLRWDGRWDSRSPGCTGLYHTSVEEQVYWYEKQQRRGLVHFP